MQPEDQLEHNSVFTSNVPIATYHQELAQQVSIGFTIDLAKRIEPTQAIPNSIFSEKFIIEDQIRAILEAKSGKVYLKLCCNSFKLDQGGTNTGVVWKDHIS